MQLFGLVKTSHLGYFLARVQAQTQLQPASQDLKPGCKQPSPDNNIMTPMQWWCLHQITPYRAWSNYSVVPIDQESQSCSLRKGSWKERKLASLRRYWGYRGKVTEGSSQMYWFEQDQSWRLHSNKILVKQQGKPCHFLMWEMPCWLAEKNPVHCLQGILCCM